MNQKLRLGVALAVASTLGASPSATDNLGFHVPSGTTLARSFESRKETSQDESDMTMNGQPIAGGKEGGMTAIQTKLLEVNDEFVQVAGAQPRKLRRTFNKIESSGEQTTQHPMDSGTQSDTRRSKSELEGKTVVFEWDAAKELFQKRFDPEGPEEKLLDGLVEDLDYRELLPPKGRASADDTWDLDIAVIKTLFVPGGDLSLKQVDAEEGADRAPQGKALLNETPLKAFAGLTGDVKATYKGSREVDGVSCGVIAVEFKVSATRELTDLPADPDAASGAAKIEKVNAFISLEGDGELVWDLSAGHARAFTMSTKIKNQFEFPMKVPSGDKFMDITRRLLLSGSYDLKVAVTTR